MSMKKILPFIFALHCSVGIGQITIDETFTAQELIQDILIDSPCAEVTNVGQRTGTDFGNVNGIGYFNANGSNFPFSDGIILMTGDVSQASGPNNTAVTLSGGDASWPGDADLEAVCTLAQGKHRHRELLSIVPVQASGPLLKTGRSARAPDNGSERTPYPRPSPATA